MRDRTRRVRLHCLTLASLVVALGVVLLAPAVASAHFVRPFVRQFNGTPTGAEGAVVPFAGPFGVAVDGENDLWVLDGDRLDEFGPSGAYRETLEPSSLSEGLEPSLAIDTSTSPLDPFAGAFYVSTGERSVEIFSKTGVLDKSFGVNVVNTSEDKIAVDDSADPLDPSAGAVYEYSGYESSSLLKFNAAGEPVNWEGFKGSANCGCSSSGNEIVFDRGGAEGAGTVAVDPADGDIWVGRGSGSINEFTPGGELIRESKIPSGKGGVASSTGMAVDPTNGDLLVATGDEGVVYELNSKGAFLGQVSEAGGQPFSGTQESAFDSSGDLYVVNHKNFNDGSVHVVDEFGLGRFDPALRPVPASQRTQTGAVLNGSVDPESELNTEKEGVVDCHFEYVSEAAFNANDVDEVQGVTVGGASGGTFSLGVEGQSTTAEGTGDLAGPASGKGDLIAGSNTIAGVSASAGAFAVGQQLSGVGIPQDAVVLSVQPGGIVLSVDATASGEGVALSAVSDEVTAVNATSGAFAVGEEIGGAGVPPGTTIVKATPGRLTLSADTASGAGDALSAALSYNASAAEVQSALESLAPVGAGNIAVKGEPGGPYTVQFMGSLADTAVPQLTTDASGLTPGGAMVTSAIQTQGGEGWGTAKSVTCEHPDAGEIPKSDAETTVHAQIREQLEAGASYRFRLVATVGGKLGGTSRSAVASFAVPHAPRVTGTAASGITSTFARLSAEVDPLGVDTTYQFQYLPVERFRQDGESWAGAAVAPAAPVDVGSGGEAGELSEEVVQSVGGLAPGTAYRFRLVASNEAGVSEGEAGVGGEIPRVFSTQPAVAPVLPDSRAYELVTPPDKEGAADMFGGYPEEPLQHTHSGDDLIQGAPERGVSSESGDQFLLSAHFSAFGPLPASGGNSYVFSRHPVAGHPEREEWSYTSLVSPALGLQSVFGETTHLVEPADFSKVAIRDAVGSPEGSVGTVGTILLGAPGGPYTTLHVDQSHHLETGNRGLEETEVITGSRDLGVVILASNNPALAEGGACEHNSCPVLPLHHLYEWAGGELSALEVLSDGSRLPCGAFIGDLNSSEEFDDGAVSADGSKVFFTAPYPYGGPEYEDVKGCPVESEHRFVKNPPEIYMRSGEETVEVSAPEEGAPEHRAGFAASFVRASEDGSRVFFTSEGELTKNDAGIHDTELYEYDTETGKLTRISAGDSGDAAGEVVPYGTTIRGIGESSAGDIAVSSDGSHVYFVARSVLAPANAEGKAPVEGVDNFYVYDTQTGRTAFIDRGDGGIEYPGPNPSSTGYAGPEVTSDGRFVLFLGEEDGQLYRYDAETESLTCVSCGPGASEGYLVPPSVIESGERDQAYILPPHSMSEDGSYVFFNTTASLVPQDTNGLLDVYEWHEGTISLLSSGQDPLPSYFLGASANGANVFFGTHARLVAADSSGGGNVYDARICEPERGNPCIAPPPAQEGLCEGDACSHPPGAPNDATPASLTFAGAGDLTPAQSKPIVVKSCPRGRRLSHSRCVKAKGKRVKAKGKRVKARAKAKRARAGAGRAGGSGKGGGRS